MINCKTNQFLEDLHHYVPGQSIADIKQKYQLNQVVKLASNENPLGPSVVLDEIKESIDAERYPDTTGLALRQALASQLTISPDNIVCGNGSDELMTMLSQVFLNSTKSIVTADCTFSVYEFVASTCGAKTIKVPLQDNTYDLGAILDAVDDTTSLVFIANPNNPTGTLCSHNEIELFLEKLPSNVVLVLDEAYIEFANESVRPLASQLLHKYPNLIVLRTFSKLYGLAAYRLGYAMANAELIQLINKVKPPFNVNSMAYEAGVKALEKSEFIKKSLHVNEKGKQRLYQFFNELELNYEASEANFIYVELNRSARDFCNECLKHGLILRPLTSFGRPNAIRVTIGTESDLDFFETVFKSVWKV